MKALLSALFILCAAATAAPAQTYPSRPIKIVVPYPAGGSVDVLARIIADKLSPALGVPVVIENRPGAAGNIGVEVVAKAAPDGYTILHNTNGTAITPALYHHLPFDPEHDLMPVTQLVATTLVLTASNKLPVTNLRELIALAKKEPGKLNYGMTGIGNPLHLTMEMLKMAAGIDIVPVAYKGDGPVFAALFAGEVDVAVAPGSLALDLIKQGRLKGLAVTNAKRAAALPDLPTVAESGVPGFDAGSWQALFMPAKTPRVVVERIQRETATALAAPDVRERLKTMGSEAVGSTPDAFAKYFAAEIVKFKKLVADAKIPPQD